MGTPEDEYPRDMATTITLHTAVTEEGLPMVELRLNGLPYPAEPHQIRYTAIGMVEAAVLSCFQAALWRLLKDKEWPDEAISQLLAHLEEYYQRVRGEQEWLASHEEEEKGEEDV